MCLASLHVVGAGAGADADAGAGAGAGADAGAGARAGAGDGAGAGAGAGSTLVMVIVLVLVRVKRDCLACFFACCLLPVAIGRGRGKTLWCWWFTNLRVVTSLRLELLCSIPHTIRSSRLCS